MSKLIKIDSDLKMTSREIAELVESRHDSVKRTVERLMSAGAVSSSTPLVDFKNSNNVTGHEFLLSKRDSYVVVAQLSPQFTARLVDRWQELEQKNKPLAIPQNFADALQLAADQARQIEEQKPAVQFVEDYTKTEGLKGFRQVCKLLKVKEPEFRAFLVAEKIMYKLGSEWTAYQTHLDTKRFEIKAVKSEERNFNTTFFTAKGITWVAGEWAKYKLNQNEA